MTFEEMKGSHLSLHCVWNTPIHVHSCHLLDPQQHFQTHYYIIKMKISSFVYLSYSSLLLTMTFEISSFHQLRFLPLKL